MNTIEAPGDALQLQFDIAAKLNFAAHQNAYTFLKSLQVSCPEGGSGFDSATLELTADPAFLLPKAWRLESLHPGESIAIKDRDVELRGDYLQGLTDSVNARITLELRADGEVLVRSSRDLELLAFNEWGGSSFMPELLAAFSLPNDPAIDRILHEASHILRNAGKQDGIDGYARKSRQRVWEIAAAIYAAVANRGITYALPPASFGTNGQKIRLPSQILSGKVATCLDTTMLFAAALEQAGLNAVVVMPKGHALVGVWLQPEELSTIVVDEAEVLRKRIQLNELVLIETTLALNGKAPSFSRAVEAGARSIPPDRDDTFVAAVDVRKARAHRIRPLGRPEETATAAHRDDEAVSSTMGLEEAPELPAFDPGLELADGLREETPQGRLERWQRKLLDLSAQNPLLNHRGSRSSLNLVCPDPGLLEDKLAAGERISLQALQAIRGSDQDEEIHRQRTGELITREYALEVLGRNQLLVATDADELSARAVEIYRKAQSALHEGGANTLFLALGFLLWKHSEKDSRRFRAPLILLPVVLDRRSARSGFTLTSHDDEARINTTLLEMLRKDFQIDIQGLDASLPADHSGIDVKGIWDKIRCAIRSSAGFEVVEDVVLGNFSFAKYLMWKDLVDRADELRDNPIVRHLIDTPREAYPSGVPFVDAQELDRSYAPSDLLTPLQADASQMSVIASADRGKDFIVIGPPGTGKSQTIANLIAHTIGKGKTVLFVAEKTAALEVVHRRLQEVGLGKFCLELHSNKARKADILDQLRKTWEQSSHAPVASWEREAHRLEEARDKLNQLVVSLHRRYPNGWTPYRAIGVRIRDEDIAGRFTLSWASVDEHDEKRMD